MARWGWLSARLLPAAPAVFTARKHILVLTEISITSVLLLHLTSALLSCVLFFFPPVCFFFFYYHTATPLRSPHAPVWMCAWPIGCDGNVRESCQRLLRAGVFVCWLVLPTYHLFIIALTVHVGLSPRVLSVLDGQLTIRNRVIWTRNYTVSSGLITAVIWTRAHKCCQLSDSVHCRLITSRTLCTQK